MASQMNPRPPALDPKSLPGRRTTNYPEPFNPLVAGREKRALGDALGLVNFGVNFVKLEPGARSSLRHWHTQQDEFVWVVEGELTLITDNGPQLLTAGMCAGFPKGKPDGHHLVNRGSRDAWYLEIGDRMPGDKGTFTDDDLVWATAKTYKATKKDGTPY
jgi:uncharacterized cupin superfamily protein